MVVGTPQGLIMSSRNPCNRERRGEVNIVDQSLRRSWRSMTAEGRSAGCSVLEAPGS